MVFEKGKLERKGYLSKNCNPIPIAIGTKGDVKMQFLKVKEVTISDDGNLNDLPQAPKGDVNTQLLNVREIK